MSQIITIDGPAGSGKSTVGRLLAKRAHLIYLDTGAMYRGVALAAKRRGMDFCDGKALGNLCKALDLRFEKHEDSLRLYLDHEDVSEEIRSPEMDMLSSKVSAVGEVREAMTGLQRRMSEGADLVAEGRDMGTVVFPHARYKFFLTASSETRVERRYQERLARGERISREDVEANLRKRDHQDATRSLAPMKPADDAVLIDSTGLTPDKVLQKILAYIER